MLARGIAVRQRTLPIEGRPGVKGERGSQWGSGEGVPDPNSGIDNDWYTNTLNGNCYCKRAGVWVLDLNIVGPEGPQGAQGVPGNDGEDGADGERGLPGLGFDAACDTYRDTGQTDGPVTATLRTIAVPINSLFWVDAVIKYLSDDRLSAGYVRATALFGRAAGALYRAGDDIPVGWQNAGAESHGIPDAAVDLVIDGNNIKVTVTGQTGVVVNWSARIMVDRG